MMSSDAQSAFETGKQKLNEKKYQEAIDAFSNAIRLAPDIGEYHAWYAQALYLDKRYEDAIREGSLAIQQDPACAKGFLLRGCAKRELGDLAGAIKDFTQTIQIEPDEPLNYTNRGFTYHKLKNYPIALEDMTKAISLDPKNPDNYRFRSDIYYDVKDWQNYILDRTRLFELKGIGKYRTDDVPNSNGQVILSTINEQFHSKTYPLLKTNKEIIVDYWPVIVVWNRETRNPMASGTSFRQEYGSMGGGFACLTDQNFRIITLGELSKQMKKSWLSSLVGFFLPLPDRLEASKTDQSWVVPNNDIQGVQIVTDPLMETESLRLVTAAMTWYLYPTYDDQRDIILAALNMARAGKFGNIWQPEEIENKPDQVNILRLLKELGELKNSGILTEQEFEEKKRELLSRL